jgi:hypothetical protein
MVLVKTVVQQMEGEEKIERCVMVAVVVGVVVVGLVSEPSNEIAQVQVAYANEIAQMTVPLNLHIGLQIVVV